MLKRAIGSIAFSLVMLANYSMAAERHPGNSLVMKNISHGLLLAENGAAAKKRYPQRKNLTQTQGDTATHERRAAPQGGESLSQSGAAKQIKEVRSQGRENSIECLSLTGCSNNSSIDLKPKSGTTITSPRDMQSGLPLE
jgi:hypothetical protein